jgi:hypothetical protein
VPDDRDPPEVVDPPLPGHRLNRQTMPFMFGLILGEFTMGAFWSVMSVVMNARTHDFAPG